MRKIWHPYPVWEDFQAGMWRILPKPEESMWIEIARQFTGNTELYGWWMMRVIEQWPLSCQHNLTSEATNHLAWIGHAACSLATGCPEYITRLAWGTLTQEQRDLANSEAENALSLWKSHNHSQDSESLPVTKSTRELGYKAKIQAWIQKWESRGYPEGIPDEAPFNLEEKLRVPSYRMVCLAIMKNDVTLETLGFARKPCNAYIAIKREEIALRERLRSNE